MIIFIEKSQDNGWTLEDYERGVKQNLDDLDALRNLLLSWKSRCNMIVQQSSYQTEYTRSTNKQLNTFDFAPFVENLQKYIMNYFEILGV